MHQYKTKSQSAPFLKEIQQRINNVNLYLINKTFFRPSILDLLTDRGVLDNYCGMEGQKKHFVDKNLIFGTKNGEG